MLCLNSVEVQSQFQQQDLSFPFSYLGHHYRDQHDIYAGNVLITSPAPPHPSATSISDDHLGHHSIEHLSPTHKAVSCDCYKTQRPCLQPHSFTLIFCHADAVEVAPSQNALCRCITSLCSLCPLADSASAQKSRLIGAFFDST